MLRAQRRRDRLVERTLREAHGAQAILAAGGMPAEDLPRAALDVLVEEPRHPAYFCQSPMDPAIESAARSQAAAIARFRCRTSACMSSV